MLKLHLTKCDLTNLIKQLNRGANGYFNMIKCTLTQMPVYFLLANTRKMFTITIIFLTNLYLFLIIRNERTYILAI